MPANTHPSFCLFFCRRRACPRAGRICKRFKPKLVLTQRAQHAHFALDAVEHPRAEPEHDEHEGDEDDDLGLDGKERAGLEEEAAYGVEAVGEGHHHCNRDEPKRQGSHREAGAGESLHEETADINEGIGVAHQQNDGGEGKAKTVESDEHGNGGEDRGNHVACGLEPKQESSDDEHDDGGDRRDKQAGQCAGNENVQA